MNNRRGLTLIEMLVSVTLTLLLVLAVVQIFQSLGETITLGRATIEMSGQLRSVASSLQANFDTKTCTLTPPIQAGSGIGYFYYEEGPAGDARQPIDSDDDGSFDSWNLSDLDADGEWDNQLYTHLGDDDDLLAMTVRAEGTPFKGKVWVATQLNGSISFDEFVIESNVAEVVWWVATLDLDNDAVADPNEPRMLLRRHFLVLPQLANQLGSNRQIIDPQTLVDVGGSVNVPTTAFWSTDLSMRKPIDTWALNSLSDLSDPRSRSLAFYGSEHEVMSGTVRMRHPQLTVTAATSWIGFPRLIAPDDNVAPPAPGPGPFVGDESPGDMGEFGKYVVIHDLLAFDVRVFDPDAPIIQDMSNSSAPVILPGDPAFFSLGTNPVNAVRMAKLGTSATHLVVNEGAFVDLAYLVNRGQFGAGGIYNNNDSETAAIGNPIDNPVGTLIGRVSSFSGLPSFRDVYSSTSTHPQVLVPSGNAATDEARFWPSVADQPSGELPGSIRNGSSDPGVIAYDTWTTAFEFDGISQDDDDNDGVIDLPGNLDSGELIDEGRDGLDSTFAAVPASTTFFGVDDPAEAESPAPYPVPLRGIEVRVRMWDVSTGQVRQVSVVGDFTN